LFKGLIFDANGDVVGPWRVDSTNTDENSSGFGAFLNSDNKYTNLLKTIGNFVKDLIGSER